MNNTKYYISILYKNLKSITFRSSLFLFLLSFVFNSSSLTQGNIKGELSIEVKGIRANKGRILLSIYNSPDGYPSESNKATKLLIAEIMNKKAELVIENLPFGEYAVSIIHDENNDGKLETNFIGIPKEGIGMSNDAKGTFGPPSFDQAKFKISKSSQTITINMVYY